MFAYETRVDVIDEYFQLAKNMVMEWMKQFGHIGKHYLYFYANIIKIGIRMIF